MMLYRLLTLGQFKEVLMDKRKSLLVLIQYSFLLTDEAKKRVINNLEKISEEEIVKLGRLLAIEKKESLGSNSDVLLDQMIHDLDDTKPTEST